MGGIGRHASWDEDASRTLPRLRRQVGGGFGMKRTVASPRDISECVPEHRSLLSLR